MSLLTGSNAPDTTSGHFALLGIVMDGELISAPRINERIGGSGIIEGRFTDEEVDVLVNVLRAGRLPAVLKADPISQNEISPLLGRDTIRQGKISIAVSLALVLVFMVVYYHFAGLVACLALLANLVLILALMIFVGAAFSLPGMAGLVLTVGMAVDANVLIFERIREELRHGAALRMAIRNGFGRATRTIVDANVTTLITAVVLYLIGNEQLRAFAVTLILGILMCLFTAIFCSRVIFDIAERRRWVKKLTMLQLLATPDLNLFGLRRPAASAVTVGHHHRSVRRGGSRSQDLRHRLPGWHLGTDSVAARSRHAHRRCPRTSRTFDGRTSGTRCVRHGCHVRATRSEPDLPDRHVEKEGNLGRLHRQSPE